MAQSLRRKKIMGMVYGLGGAIVIIGALFKLLHFNIGFLTGGVMLTIGLLTEAAIFTISAFDPVYPDLNWTNVYPELVEDSPIDKKEETNTTNNAGLTYQLDQAISGSELDVELVNSLSQGIRSFKTTVENIGSQVSLVNATEDYNNQITSAAQKLESLNELYEMQLERIEEQNEVNKVMMESAKILQDQMQLMSQNINTLNTVYEGMLQAMQPKQ